EEHYRHAVRCKDHFMATLGHELRNPLSAVCHALEVQKAAAPVDPIVVKTRQIIERQIMHMARIVDGLLDVSRVVMRRIRLEREPVDMAALVRLVVEDQWHRITSKGLDLELAVPSEPLWVDGDRTRLSQIVDNLLGNAVKF